MIRFRQLEAFRHLMVAGTSIGAARRMEITQPAVSRLIADLEAELGFTLFNRTKNRLEPTRGAARFYQAVEENFLGLERLSQVAESIRDDVPDNLTIACQTTLCTSLLPPILQRFLAHHPDISVALESRNPSEILVALQDLKADVAICSELPDVAGIEVEPLLEVPLLCALPDGHKLTRKTRITLQDLRNENVIGWLPSSTEPFIRALALLEEAGIRPRYPVKTHSSHARYAMVAAGLGVSIVEPFSAAQWREQGVSLRPFEPTILYKYVLAYPSNAVRSDLVEDFREAVLKIARSYQLEEAALV